MLEEPLANGPAFIQLAYQVSFFGDGVIQESFTKVGSARNQLNGLNGYALLVHWQQYKANTLMLRRLVIRPNEAEHPVSKLRTGRPNLLAINGKVITLIIRLGAQSSQVRTSPRLTVALAPVRLSLGNRGQVSLLLVVRSIFEERRTEHAGAHIAQRRPSVNGRHFFIQYFSLLKA